MNVLSRAGLVFNKVLKIIHSTFIYRFIKSKMFPNGRLRIFENVPLLLYMNGKPVCRISNRRFHDIFWYKYNFEPVEGGPSIEVLQQLDFWYEYDIYIYTEGGRHIGTGGMILPQESQTFIVRGLDLGYDL